MRRLKVYGLLALVYSLVLLGCEKSSGLLEDRDQADDLRNSPEEIKVNGVDYDLSAYAVRNFTPAEYPNGSALFAGIILEAENGELSDGILFSSVHIIHEDEIWTPPLININREDDQVEIIVQNGPRWPEGADVDVVLNFIVEMDGRLHSIRESDVEIEAIY
jgi:hypothetical protein